jgi:hypothetical protein
MSNPPDTYQAKYCNTKRAIDPRCVMARERFYLPTLSNKLFPNCFTHDKSSPPIINLVGFITCFSYVLHMFGLNFQYVQNRLPHSLPVVETIPRHGTMREAALLGRSTPSLADRRSSLLTFIQRLFKFLDFSSCFCG